MLALGVAHALIRNQGDGWTNTLAYLDRFLQDRRVASADQQAAADAMKSGAATNDLFDRIAADSLFGIDRASIDAIARPEGYTGLAKQQTERFLIEDVDPILERERSEIRAEAGEVRV